MAASPDVLDRPLRSDMARLRRLVSAQAFARLWQLPKRRAFQHPCNPLCPSHGKKPPHIAAFATSAYLPLSNGKKLRVALKDRSFLSRARLQIAHALSLAAPKDASEPAPVHPKLRLLAPNPRIAALLECLISRATFANGLAIAPPRPPPIRLVPTAKPVGVAGPLNPLNSSPPEDGPFLLLRAAWISAFDAFGPDAQQRCSPTVGWSADCTHQTHPFVNKGPDIAKHTALFLAESSWFFPLLRGDSSSRKCRRRLADQAR